MTHIDPESGDAALGEIIAPERVHRPGTPGYDAATRLWNGAVTHRPVIVVQPKSHADVQTVVHFARECGIPILVRGGGHDWAGRSVVDDGLVIDMSLMRRVIIDKATSVATVAGGATAADVVAAAEPHGLAATTGMVGEVGMVGLTLAGGYGPLNGVGGLAIDNVIGAELVLGDGRAVSVDAQSEPDLLWAPRSSLNCRTNSRFRSASFRIRTANPSSTCRRPGLGSRRRARPGSTNSRTWAHRSVCRSRGYPRGCR